MGGTKFSPRRRTSRWIAVLATMALVPLVAVIGAPSAGAAMAVQDIAGGLTPTQLAQALAGDGVAVSNVEYTGANVAAGSFTGAADSIGFDGGVVLSSGRVKSTDVNVIPKGVEGPNVSTGNGTSNSTLGDADLNAIITPVTTNDAAVLEFDFIPQFSTLQFEYVFGSEEYNEFVGSFNDVFAFFVNGVNCATIPDTESTPVSINNVNLTVNPGFYRNNDASVEGQLDTELDGLTTVLPCDAAVNAGSINHLKLAVADASDSALDTAVFIRSGSLVSGTSIDATLASGDDTGTALTVPSGAGVTVNATLSGANAGIATGNVSYLLFSDETCSGVLEGQSKTVTEGVVPPSDPFTLTNPGTYYFRANYLGDANNNASATTCGALTATVDGEPPADPLVVSLAPLTGSNPVNSSHTVTATVSRGSVPQAGVAVSFAVVSGPNVELTGSGTTNASGQASFAYSSELAGTDTIQASVFDSPFETTRTSNTVTKTWTVSNVQLEVASTTEPETVTRGGFVRQTYVISNTGTAGATGVDFAVALPAGASVFSNTTSQGSCVALSGALSCALGSIAPGGSVTVVAVLQVPAAFPPGPFQTTVSTSSDQTDSQSGAPPAPADVIVPAPGMAFGYVPPGGTLRTAATATPADNTVAAFTLPGYGGGAPISLIAEPTTATFCGGLPCTGKVFELSTFEGYYDPARPPRLELIYDRSIYGRGQHSTVYVLKENQVTPSKVRECKPNPAWGSLTPPKHRSRHWKPDFRPLLSKLLSALGFGPWSGYASPSPCVNKKWTDHQGDVHFEILVLSGDPRFARR